jgi:SAM-dependent methyltransferase
MTDYDEVRYPCHAYAHTHPEHLYVLARLHGMNPVKPEKCRVLEIGCGDGANLLPMAWHLPEGRFFGFDLAKSTIDEGRALVEKLGIKNLELRHLDLMEFPEEEGPFDYIIAHGFYSWVPDFVRERMLALVKRILSPQGVAFISYNAYPGGHVRTMIREMVLFHTDKAPDAASRVSQAMAFLGFLHQGMVDVDEHGRILKAEVERVQKFHPAHFFHDDMAAINQAYYIHEFAARADSHGLQYLDDADFPSTQDNRFPPDVKETLAELSGNIIMKEQYLDFLKFRRFRQTLLCHGELRIEHVLKPSGIREFFLGGPVVAGDRAAGEWRTAGGTRLRSKHPVSKAAFGAIGRKWPGRYDFATLANEVMKETGGPIESVEEVLEKVLWEALTTGLIDAWPDAGNFTSRPSEKPRACALVRRMLELGDSIVTRLHSTVAIGDAAGKYLISLLDGTRDRAALTREMANSEVLKEQEPDPAKRQALAKANVETGLEQLAKLTLLEA